MQAVQQRLDASGYVAIVVRKSFQEKSYTHLQVSWQHQIDALASAEPKAVSS